jgi:hypothetical protein
MVGWKSLVEIETGIGYPSARTLVLSVEGKEKGLDLGGARRNAGYISCILRICYCSD